MTTATDYMSGAKATGDQALVQSHSFPVKAAAILFGFGFIWAGAGLWLVPGPELEPTVLLTKMFLSVMMVTAGVGMTQIATEKPRRELHFDGRHRQVHVVDGKVRGRTQIVKSINYEDVARVDVTDTRLVMLDDAGRVLTEMALDGPHARLDAIAHLRSQSLFPA